MGTNYGISSSSSPPGPWINQLNWDGKNEFCQGSFSYDYKTDGALPSSLIKGSNAICQSNTSYEIDLLAYPLVSMVNWTVSNPNLVEINRSGSSLLINVASAPTQENLIIYADVTADYGQYSITSRVERTVSINESETHSNEIWATDTSIKSCKINLTNVTIQQSELEIDIAAGTELIINGTFDAPLGTELNITN